jgi:hypothetical protein
MANLKLWLFSVGVSFPKSHLLSYLIKHLFSEIKDSQLHKTDKNKELQVNSVFNFENNWANQLCNKLSWILMELILVF